MYTIKTALMKNILLVDDHAIVRKGIKSIIAEHLPSNEVDEAGSEQEIIQRMKQKQYHLILLDLQIPDTDFSKLMEWIQVRSPEANILIFSLHAEEMYGLRCLHMGAKGFLSKSASNEEIIYAISKVLNGEKYLSQKLSELLIDSAYNPNAPENPFDRLSQREMEIVTQLEKGKSLTEISQILKIQYSTVNTYKRRIFEKLNVRSVLDLAKMVQSFDKLHF
jgi:two-component system invasion response regulator UvrY